ncbi:nucleoside-diphosphate kinase [Candidatus Woesearchaeota archaeon]|nr:nucleoside-diphosphate kinase [Candidatus Woesearchaeota archaeon]
MKEFVEKTFIAVKHDGVQRGLIGEIIKRFEQRGLRIAAIKMVQADKELASKHYPMSDEWVSNTASVTRNAWKAKGIELKENDEEICTKINAWLKDYITEGPVVAMVWEGPHAIEIGRKLVGTASAKNAPPGTIRGDFTTDSYELADKKQRPVRNLIHASGTKAEAENEVNLWFKENELFDYDIARWNIMH